MPKKATPTEPQVAQEEVVMKPVAENDGAIYNENGEEVLFEGGPTIAMIEEFKRRYGNIYITDFENGDVYIYRALNRKEWREIKNIQNADALYQEERICDSAVIWPKTDPGKFRIYGAAGVPTVLAEQILEISGFIPNVTGVKL
jgi:hypothetical protein